MDRLNLTLTQGYPSKGSDAGGLQRDQFIKASKSQGKRYGLHPNQNKPTGSISFWHCDTAKLNSTYSRIARSSGLTTPAPPSRYISQDTLRKWEKSAREATYMCNQILTRHSDLQVSNSSRIRKWTLTLLQILIHYRI